MEARNRRNGAAQPAQSRTSRPDPGRRHPRPFRGIQIRWIGGRAGGQIQSCITDIHAGFYIDQTDGHGRHVADRAGTGIFQTGDFTATAGVCAGCNSLQVADQLVCWWFAVGTAVLPTGTTGECVEVLSGIGTFTTVAATGVSAPILQYSFSLCAPVFRNEENRGLAILFGNHRNPGFVHTCCAVSWHSVWCTARGPHTRRSATEMDSVYSPRLHLRHIRGTPPASPGLAPGSQGGSPDFQAVTGGRVCSAQVSFQWALDRSGSVNFDK